jgi:hypothetical protein
VPFLGSYYRIVGPPVQYFFLDGDIAIQTRVSGAVHLAHATLADESKDGQGQTINNTMFYEK